MQKVKIIARSFNKKDGGTFTKLTIKGKFINDVLAEDEENYVVKFTASSQVKEPTKEGIYEVAFNDREAWIDSRPEVAGAHIFRIVAQKVKYNKPLPLLEKDIREVK